MAQPQPIDLSAGLQPKSGGGIDLSAGLEPIGQSAHDIRAGLAGPSWNVKGPGVLDKANNFYNAPAQPGEGIASRLGRSLGRTAMMVPNLVQAAVAGPSEEEKAKGFVPPVLGDQGSLTNLPANTFDRALSLPFKHLAVDPSRQSYQQIQGDVQQAEETQGHPLTMPQQAVRGAEEGISMVPLLGPLLLSIARRIDPGTAPGAPPPDIAGGVADALTMHALPEIQREASPGGRLPGAPEAGELALPATRAALGKVAEKFPQAVQTVRGAISPEAMTAEQAATKAFRPRNSKANWQQEVASALPDARRAADALKLDPNAMTLDDALAATSQAKKDVWGEYEHNFKQPNQDVAVDTTSVAGALRKTLSDRQIEQNPNFADRINEIADNYSGRKMSLQDVEDRVRELNNETRGIEAKYLTDKRAAKLDPQNAPLFAERDTLRQLMLDKMDELSGPGAAQLRKRWGALNSLEDVVSRRIPVAQRQVPNSLPSVLAKAYAAGKVARGVFTLNPADILEGGVSLLSQRKSALLNDPDYLTQLAFRKTVPRSPFVPRFQGDYQAPAASAPPVPPVVPKQLYGMQLEHMQPVDGEYVQPPAPPIRGLLNRGQYNQPPTSPEDFEFNQPQLPAKASAIPLRASTAIEEQPRANVPVPVEPNEPQRPVVQGAGAGNDEQLPGGISGRVQSSDQPQRAAQSAEPGPGSAEYEALKNRIAVLERARRGSRVQPSPTTQVEAQPQPEPQAQPTSKPQPAAQPKAVAGSATAPGVYGSQTQVLTSGQNLPGKYRVVEADSLIPSHDAGTFAPNPKYPQGVQERTYHTSKEAQARVIQQAQQYDPNYTINTNPDAVNGPPVVTKDGIVLGGNSRTMSTQRLYSAGRGDAYKNELVRQAGTFGLDSQQIAKMNRPVLVREVTPTGGAEGMRRLGADLNKSMTGALGVQEKAVSAGRSIKPETLDSIGKMRDDLGEGATLRDVLREHGKEVLGMLTRDGAVTDRERPQLIDTGPGGLSEEGKTFVERALLGSVVDDPVLMEKAPKNILDKVGSSLGELSSLSARDDHWNIVPLIREALADHAEMASTGNNMATYLNQPRMFGAQRSPAVEAVVRSLGGKPKAVKQALRDFADAARMNQPGQATLGLMRVPTASEAFNEAFDSNVSEDQLIDAIRDSMAKETPHDVQRFKK